MFFSPLSVLLRLAVPCATTWRHCELHSNLMCLYVCFPICVCVCFCSATGTKSIARAKYVYMCIYCRYMHTYKQQIVSRANFHWKNVAHTSRCTNALNCNCTIQRNATQFGGVATVTMPGFICIMYEWLWTKLLVKNYFRILNSFN